jgi:hypothetical protein
MMDLTGFAKQAAEKEKKDPGVIKRTLKGAVKGGVTGAGVGGLAGYAAGKGAQILGKATGATKEMMRVQKALKGAGMGMGRALPAKWLMRLNPAISAGRSVPFYGALGAGLGGLIAALKGKKADKKD